MNPADKLVNFDLYAPVFRAPFSGLVIGDRLAFTEALSGYSAAFDAFLYNIVLYCGYAPFGQTLVVSFGTYVVSVPREARLLIFVLVHESDQAI